MPLRASPLVGASRHAVAFLRAVRTIEGRAASEAYHSVNALRPERQSNSTYRKSR